MIGPILTLKTKSALCPCLTTQQDNGAIGAMNTLSSISVIYHDSSENTGAGGAASAFVSNAGKGVGKFVSGLLGSSNKQQRRVEPTHSLAFFDKKNSPRQWSLMSIVDTLGGPALSIQYSDNNNNNNNNNNENDNGNDDPDTNTKSHVLKIKTRTIALKRIGEIIPDDSFLSTSSARISIHTKKRHRNDETFELCRLDLLHRGADMNPLGSEDRDDIINSIQLLIQWDLDRRTSKHNNGTNANDEEDEDEGDEEEERIRSKRQGLGQRALKMKHFAEREIEMKKQRTDRESRKAKYLKESGGLKYTALAMANKQMAS